MELRELFIRASLLDDRLTLNGSLPCMDFKNAQCTIPVVISPGVMHALRDRRHAGGYKVRGNF